MKKPVARSQKPEVRRQITLTPELEKYIQSKIDSKMYKTASEVVSAALRVLEDHHVRFEAFKREMQAGLDQLDRGEYIEIFDDKDEDALLERIERNGRARLAAKGKRRAG